MPSPELIDERFDEIVRELRALPGAPETLRRRVLERPYEEEERKPAASWRRWLSLRMTGWTLATAAAGLVAVSMVYGLATSGGPTRSASEDTASSGGGEEGVAGAQTVPAANAQPHVLTSAQRSAASPPEPPPAIVDGGAFEAAPVPKSSAGEALGALERGAVTLPPGKRLAQYTASMRLRVSDIDELSRTTREAMRITRRLGGFVSSVNYAKPKGEEGDATLRLRVPAAKIQQAIAELSDLGVIVSQQIRITDVQNQVNDATSEIARLRRTIRRIEARLKQPISEEEEYRLQLQLENARQSLKQLTERRAATVRRARLATIALALTTREAEESTPAAPPGRIERAARNAGALLSKEVAAVVYFFIAASPLILLGAAALVAGRVHRRRFEQRLLEQA